MNITSRTPAFSGRHLAWSVVATLVLVSVAFRSVALDDVWRILQHADWRPTALATGVFVLTLLAKTARWQIFFSPSRPRFESLCAALSIGVAVNFLLPARLGEAARVYVMKRREGDHVARMAATIAAEKLVELSALYVVAMLALPFVPLPGWLRGPSLRLTLLLPGALLLLATLFLEQAPLRRVWAWLVRKAAGRESAGAERQFDLALEGFTPLRRRHLLMPIAAWSSLIWVLMIATNYLLFFALPMQPSWLQAAVLLVVLNIGVAVPSTPGKLGVFPALTTLTLPLFGVSREMAFSYGTLLYIVVFVPQLIIAGPFVWQELASLRGVPRAVETAS